MVCLVSSRQEEKEQALLAEKTDRGRIKVAGGRLREGAALFGKSENLKRLIHMCDDDLSWTEEFAALLCRDPTHSSTCGSAVGLLLLATRSRHDCGREALLIRRGWLDLASGGCNRDGVL